MESLESFTDCLHVPWRSRVRSILACTDVSSDDFRWPEFFDSTAFATEISPLSIKCELACFQPYGSLRLYDPTIPCEIFTTEGCKDFAANSWIGFYHAKVLQHDPLQIEIGQKAAIWNIANIERTLPLTIGHLCAGAFGGWDRAFQWLVGQKTIYNPDVFAVESDYDILRTWCKAKDAVILEGPISPQVPRNERNIGIFAPIQDCTWYNMCRQPVNMVFTASPPCQTWSSGGRKFGLEAENGMTFMQVVHGVKWVRPVCCLLECSDTVPGHAHYIVIQKAFKYIGYKQCWSQIIPLHNFTGMKRSRWISLFIRLDVQEFDVVGFLKLADPLHKMWSDPAYDFFLPSDVVDQLQLTEDLKLIYGDPKFLPCTKRDQFGQKPKLIDVLDSRCLMPDENMPTLCASYASQHELDCKHLANRGIFAALCKKGDKYAFIDPARFAALLGVTADQGITFPKNIADAFHQLGNSISVVHAMIGVSIALTVLGFSRQPIMYNVVKCWEDRIVASNTITLSETEFLRLVACEKVEKTMMQSFIMPEKPVEPIIIQIASKNIPVEKSVTIFEFIEYLGIQAPIEQGLILTIDGETIQHHEILSKFIGKNFGCSKRGFSLFNFRVEYPPVQPTAPWTCPEPDTDLVNKEEDDEINPQLLHEAVVCAESLCERIVQHPTEQIAVFPSKASNECGFVSIEVPIHLDYDQTSQWIAQAIGARDNNIIWYEAVHFQQPYHQRCVIADNVGNQTNGVKLVIVQVKGENPFVCKLPNPVLPFQIPGFEQSNEIHHNGISVGKHSIVSVEHGDDFLVHDGSKRRKITKVPSKTILPIQQRVDMLIEEKQKLGTDEYAILQRIVNESNAPIKCADAWEYTAGISGELAERIRAFCSDTRAGVTLACPILHNDHWAAFELTKCASGFQITFCNMPETLLQHVQHELICRFSDLLKHLSSRSIVIPVLHGFCGWALMFRWFKKFDVKIPNDHAYACPSTLYAAVHNSIEGDHQWGNVSSFALKGRLCCFQKFGTSYQVTSHVRFGATGNEQNPPDASMKDANDAKTTDPWLKFDPWQKGQKQCKWEDLTLPKDHPIHDSQHARLQQIHRHQLSLNVGGVAFCTKSTVNDILAKSPNSLLHSSYQLVISCISMIASNSSFFHLVK